MQNFNPKIYLKDSDKARLADVRIRIVYDNYAVEPCNDEDLVFEKAESKESIPSNALKTWYFSQMDIWFFTTAERCKKMVSPDPAYWTSEKLDFFAEVEKQLYADWYDGSVYGIVREKWDAAQRTWATESSTYGIYGAKALHDMLADEAGSIPICIDSEEMKYDFGNVETHVNEFK